MTRRPALPTTLARLSLLLAAILQIAAAGVGPWVHLSLLDPAAAGATVGAPADEGGNPAVPHDELSCVFCHTLAGAAVAEGARLIVTADLAAAPAAASVRSTPSRPDRRSPSARAPPVA